MTDAAIEARLHLSYVDVIKIECATHITVWRRRWNFFFLLSFIAIALRINFSRPLL